MSSRVDAWHRFQSKKKGKKQNLVASSTRSLGEAFEEAGKGTQPRVSDTFKG